MMMHDFYETLERKLNTVNAQISRCEKNKKEAREVTFDFLDWKRWDDTERELNKVADAFETLIEYYK